MEIGKSAIAVFDSKSYDRDYLSRASGADKLDLRFHEFRLKPETAFAGRYNPGTELFAPRRGRAYYRSHSCLEPQNPSGFRQSQGIELFAQRFGGVRLVWKNGRYFRHGQDR